MTNAAQDYHGEMLKKTLDESSYAKLMQLANPKLHRFVADAIELLAPDRAIVCSDAPEDIAAIRQMAIDNKEEIPLVTDGHTAHFDGYHDQARDKKATKYLVPKDMPFEKNLNQTEREQGLEEVRSLMKGAMAGKTMIVRFFCLGPVNSAFSIPCAQITDSSYVAHSEDLLYRPGYEEFRRIGDSEAFFRFMHSAGRLSENMTSIDVDKRRIYIDIDDEMVYSVNTQYAGNTVGLKKLALRLAIRKADREGWLAEHMFVMGEQAGGDTKYFAGAFPSACGKTSTAMLPNETIIGDDIAYLRVVDNSVRAVNVEKGIFGIIRDVNPDDDPIIYKALTTPGEVIFSNVLVKDGKPYWMGMGQELPREGVNHSGPWHPGKFDDNGDEVTPSHKNARYTVSLHQLDNTDPELDNPDGVPLSGVIYGGRDSDTSVPVKESFDWTHGIIAMGASLESETTAATLGAEGVRSFNLMSILDFLAIPLGKYIENNLDFPKSATDVPRIFAVNYFLKGPDNKYLNGIRDKAVWLKWMGLRVRNKAEAIDAPTGRIPVYEDLKRLFSEVLDKDYTREDYIKQFSIRVPENLEKIDRIENIYRDQVADTPQALFDQLAAQRDRLKSLQSSKGDLVSPIDL